MPVVPRALWAVFPFFPFLLLRAPCWSRGHWSSLNPRQTRGTTTSPHSHICKDRCISISYFRFNLPPKQSSEQNCRKGEIRRGQDKGTSPEKCIQLLSKTKVLGDFGDILCMVFSFVFLPRPHFAVCTAQGFGDSGIAPRPSEVTGAVGSIPSLSESGPRKYGEYKVTLLKKHHRGVQGGAPSSPKSFLQLS